jgi:hypothetical protein
VNKWQSDTSERLIRELEVLNREVMKSVLTFGEMSLSESQFRAFRKVVFDLYGGNGLQGKVRELVSKTLGLRLDRAGVLPQAGQEDGKKVVSMR